MRIKDHDLVIFIRCCFARCRLTRWIRLSAVEGCLIQRACSLFDLYCTAIIPLSLCYWVFLCFRLYPLQLYSPSFNTKQEPSSAGRGCPHAYNKRKCGHGDRPSWSCISSCISPRKQRHKVSSLRYTRAYPRRL